MIPYIGIDPTGTRRRVQALQARGWSYAELDRRLGWRPGNISKITTIRDLLQPRTVHSIGALYEELWAAQPPLATSVQRNAAIRAQNRARRLGWVPPLAWDDIDTDDAPPAAEADRDFVDEVAVALAVNGDRVRLTPRERRVALRRVHALGCSDYEIATRLNMPKRVAFRIRCQELHLPANVDAAGERVAS